MDKGNVCHDGMDRAILDKYDMVLSGHFHHKSSDGSIIYVGTPGEMTWADYNDPRGFHIFDTVTRELEFIENPFKMFHKIVYDENSETLESVTNKDFSQYNNVIVKVVVVNKSNPYAFDLLFDSMYKAGPLDIQIVEDASVLIESEEELEVDEAEDTATILRKYVTGLTLPVDNGRMKEFMIDIYNEALQVETV